MGKYGFVHICPLVTHILNMASSKIFTKYGIMLYPMFDLICSFIFAMAHNIQPRPPYLYINMADDLLIKFIKFFGKIYSNTYYKHKI